MSSFYSPYGRDEAWQLLTEWTAGESLRKHALAVEACVVACGEADADRLGLAGEQRAELLNLYSTTALLHDFDYRRRYAPIAAEKPDEGMGVEKHPDHSAASQCTSRGETMSSS